MYHDGIEHYGRRGLQRDLHVDVLTADGLDRAKAQSDVTRDGTLGRQRAMHGLQRFSIDARGDQQCDVARANRAVAGSRQQ